MVNDFDRILYATNSLVDAIRHVKVFSERSEGNEHEIIGYCNTEIERNNDSIYSIYRNISVGSYGEIEKFDPFLRKLDSIYNLVTSDMANGGGFLKNIDDYESSFLNLKEHYKSNFENELSG